MAIGLPEPEGDEEQTLSLRHSAGALLRELEARGRSQDPQALGVAFTMPMPTALQGTAAASLENPPLVIDGLFGLLGVERAAVHREIHAFGRSSPWRLCEEFTYHRG